MKKLMVIFCIISFIFSLPAFAYKKETHPKSSGAQKKQEEQVQTSEEKTEKKDEEEIEDVYTYKRPGSKLITTGYIFIGVGSAAAIVGSTMITATDKDITGAIISGSGAMLALAGSMMVLFGSHEGYAFGPMINPKRGAYGIAVAANF